MRHSEHRRRAMPSGKGVKFTQSMTFSIIMKTFIRQINKHQAGVMLMEMLLVMPLYMLVFGGIYYLGESVLMDNRILLTGRSKGYLALHLSVENAFEEVMRHFQDKDGSLRNDGAEMAALAYYTDNPTLVTETPWGAVVNSYATLKEVPLPIGIEGMLRMGDSLFRPDAPPDNVKYTMSFGTRQETESSLRHWLVARVAKLPDSRPHMGDIVSASESVQGGSGNARYQENNCKYYTKSVNYVYHAVAAISENWLLAKSNGEQAPDQSKWESYFYPRAYVTFFSNH